MSDTNPIGLELPGQPGAFRIEPGRLNLFRPHKYPMIILEEVTACQLSETEKVLIGKKTVKPDDPYVQAHFPGDPFMPASFVVEGLAQAAGCLMNLLFFYDQGVRLWELSTPEFLKLTQPPYNVLAEAKIKHLDLAMPGEALSLRAKVALQRKEIIAFQTEAKVGERLIAHGDIILAYPPYMPTAVPQELREESNVSR